MAVIGIDLGTSNSLVAAWSKDGPQTFPNALGKMLTPSAVSVSDTGEVLVGQAAIERLITHPDRTAASFKRAMGSSKVFHLAGHAWRAEELSAFVLKSLREDAEMALGETVSEAIISVPAYFNDMQRKATLDAARLAGLHVERLINEPTAAALAHGLENVEEGSFLILDLGGGTFDVSILHKFDEIMEIKASAGDSMLGGDDFRAAIAALIATRHDFAETRLEAPERARLLVEAERLKQVLSDRLQAEYSFVTGAHAYEGVLERTEFEEHCQSLVRRLRAPIECAIRDARIDIDQLDQVVLVGGASRMPLVRSLATRLFGRFPMLHPQPDHVIALGTAVQAALKTREGALQEVVMTDVCPFTLGTAIVDRRAQGEMVMSPIIERNAIVPISRESRYYTVVDGQTKVSFDVLQGEHMRPAQNIKIGEIAVDVPPGPAGSEAIDVRYTYDVNGALEVEVKVVSTGKQRRAVFRNQSSLSDAELDARFAALSAIKILPRDQQENRTLIARAERLYAEALGDQRELIKELLFQFEHAIADQSRRDIVEIRRQFSEGLQQFEGFLF